MLHVSPKGKLCRKLLHHYALNKVLIGSSDSIWNLSYHHFVWKLRWTCPTISITFQKTSIRQSRPLHPSIRQVSGGEKHGMIWTSLKLCFCIVHTATSVVFRATNQVELLEYHFEENTRNMEVCACNPICAIHCVMTTKMQKTREFIKRDHEALRCSKEEAVIVSNSTSQLPHLW